MDLFIVLIVVLGLLLILTIILLIAALNSFAPFRKMKDKELNDCYDLNNLRVYNKNIKKRNK
jgi:hypothetical protein